MPAHAQVFSAASSRGRRGALYAAALAAALGAGGGCVSSASGGARAAAPVAPAAPPRDDGKASAGNAGGAEHAAALEELRGAPLGWARDRDGSVRVLLPDAPHWLRVRFWGMKSVVGFRYGKEHHAVVGAVVVSVADETAPGACRAAFERSTQPYVDAFDVVLEREPPRAAPWDGKIADIDVLVAKTATLGVRDEYAVAYGMYPAWPGRCLVLGVAVPARGQLERAKAVRDRFAADVLPKVRVTSKTPPQNTY